MTENITDFIRASVNDKPSEAEAAFDAIMQDKVATAVDKASVEYKKNMFNTDQEEKD